MFDGDRSVHDRNDDILDRYPFAEHLGKSVAEWKEDYGLVIGLYGEWGSGKTSIANMMTNSFNDDKSPNHKLRKPYVVQYNPWEWASQGSIFQAFFEQVGLTIAKEPDTKTLGRSFIKLKDALTGVEPFLIVKDLLEMFLSISAASLVVLSATNKIFILKCLAVFSALIVLSRHVEKYIETHKKIKSEKSIVKIKDDIRTKLMQLDRPILVVVDDIDRLTSEEILTVFQMVKVNTDFPNMVFLMMFQRDIVEGKIPNGKDYIEKIIQVGIDIPAISSSVIKEFILHEIEKTTGINMLADNRKRIIFENGIMSYMSTLREAKRYISSLSFYYAIFNKENGVFEVNKTDLIALECLRVFEPEVYKRIYNSCGELVITSDYNLVKNNIPADHEALQGFCDIAVNQYAINRLLPILFPALLKQTNGYEREWLKELFVCDKDNFEKYFQFNIPEGTVSETDYREILELISNLEGFVSKLNQLNQNGLLGQILRKIGADVSQIPADNAISFVKALSVFYEENPKAVSQFNEISRIIYWYFMQFEHDTYLQVYDGVFTEDTTLAIEGYLLYMQNKDIGGTAQFNFVFTDDEYAIRAERYITKVKKTIERTPEAFMEKKSCMIIIREAGYIEKSAQHIVHMLTRTDELTAKFLHIYQAYRGSIHFDNDDLKQLEFYMPLDRVRVFYENVLKKRQVEGYEGLADAFRYVFEEEKQI